MTEPSPHTEVEPDTVQKAKDLYAMLTGLTSTPREALQIIKIMHILLWINGKADDASVDDMLTSYVFDFKDNLRANGELEPLH